MQKPSEIEFTFKWENWEPETLFQKNWLILQNMGHEFGPAALREKDRDCWNLCCHPVHDNLCVLKSWRWAVIFVLAKIHARITISPWWSCFSCRLRWHWQLLGCFYLRCKLQIGQGKPVGTNCHGEPTTAVFKGIKRVSPLSWQLDSLLCSMLKYEQAPISLKWSIWLWTHRVTEWLCLEGTLEVICSNVPDQAGPPKASCPGPCPVCPLSLLEPDHVILFQMQWENTRSQEEKRRTGS